MKQRDKILLVRVKEKRGRTSLNNDLVMLHWYDSNVSAKLLYVVFIVQNF